MAQRNGFDRESRSISLPGILQLIAGWGMVFGYLKFSTFSDAWSLGQRYLFFVVAFCLTLSGLKQIVSSWQQRRDGSSNLSRLPRHRVSIPVEGIVYLVMMAVMFMGAMLGRNNMPLLVFAVMAAAFVINGFISFHSLRKLSVERQIPEVITAGDAFSVYITIANRKRMTVWVLQVRDAISNGRESLTADVIFTRIAWRSRQTGEYRLQLMQRGRYVLGPVLLSTRFPLGIVQRSLLLPERQEVIVCPRPGKLLIDRRSAMQSDEIVYRRDSRHGLYEDEFHRIREYRSGDNPRAIHWRTSARRNELMVREFRENRDENLLILLDMWQPETPTLEDLECVETAVSFAVTLFRAHLDGVRDSELHLACSGRSFTTWAGQSGYGSWEALLRFAGVQVAGPASDLRPLKEFWFARKSPDLRTVLVTTRPLDELSRILGESNSREDSHVQGNGHASSFEQEVLMYTAAGHALDSIFVPPHRLIPHALSAAGS